MHVKPLGGTGNNVSPESLRLGTTTERPLQRRPRSTTPDYGQEANRRHDGISAEGPLNLQDFHAVFQSPGSR